MEIQTSTETVTITKYTIELTEADVAAILVDPAPLQRQLRGELRGAGKRGRHGAKNISLNGHKKPKPKEKANAAGKAADGKGGGFAKTPCPECGKPISKAQLRNHLAKKHGVTAAASPASD